MYLLVIVVLFLGLRMPFLGIAQRWDADAYFIGLQEAVDKMSHAPNLVVFFKAMVNGLNWFGHPTLGYGFVMSISQIFHSGSPVWVNAENNAMAVVAIVAFYFVIKYFRPGKELENGLSTALFAFNPLFWGVSFFFGPDFGILVFYVCFVAAFLYQKHWLAFIFAMLLVSSKEIGVMIYATHTITYFLIEWKNSKKHTKLRRFWLFLPLLFFGVNYLLRIFTRWQYATVSCQGKTKFCAGYSPYNIRQVFGVVFVLSFQWINSLIIIFGFRRLKKYIPKLLPIMITFLILVAFHLIFITNVVPRYTVVSVFVTTLLTILIVGQFKAGLLRVLVLLVMILLSFLSIYRTFDPISLRYFGFMDIGRRHVVKIGLSAPADGMVYNMEYTMIDRLLNQTFKMIALRPEDVIMLNEPGWSAWVDGWWPYMARVDAATFTKTMMKHNSFVPIATGTAILDPGNLHQSPYYIRMNWLDNPNSLETLLEYYKIDWGKRVEINSYYLDVYKLKKK